MDEDNLAWLQSKAPRGSLRRLELLMAHASATRTWRQVPDPYYGAGLPDSTACSIWWRTPATGSCCMLPRRQLAARGQHRVKLD